MSYYLSLGLNIHVSHLLFLLLPFHPRLLPPVPLGLQIHVSIAGWTRYSFSNRPNMCHKFAVRGSESNVVSHVLYFCNSDTQLSNSIWVVNLCGCKFIFYSSREQVRVWDPPPADSFLPGRPPPPLPPVDSGSKPYHHSTLPEPRSSLISNRFISESFDLSEAKHNPQQSSYIVGSILWGMKCRGLESTEL